VLAAGLATRSPGARMFVVESVGWSSRMRSRLSGWDVGNPGETPGSYPVNRAGVEAELAPVDGYDDVPDYSGPARR
jgi:hypothetical protein